jgi:hypothetical protein
VAAQALSVKLEQILSYVVMVVLEFAQPLQDHEFFTQVAVAVVMDL